MTLFSRTGTLIMAVLFSLSGCTTAVISSSKSPAFSQPISSASILYVGAPMSNKAASPSLGTILGTPRTIPFGASADKVTTDARAFGEQVVQKLPSAMLSAGMKVDAQAMQTANAVASKADYEKLVGTKEKIPLLVITPVSARMECPSACFAFRLEVQLLDSDYSTPLWTAVFDAPPKESRFADFSAPAKDFSAALVKQLRTDNVIR